MKRLTCNTLPDWASFKSVQAKQDDGVLAHFPNERLNNSHATCDLTSPAVDPVLGFEDNDLFYLAADERGRYALIKRTVRRRKRADAGIILGFLLGFLVAFVLIVGTGLALTAGDNTAPKLNTVLVSFTALSGGPLAGYFIGRALSTRNAGGAELVEVYEDEEAVLENEQIRERLLAESDPDSAPPLSIADEPTTRSLIETAQNQRITMG